MSNKKKNWPDTVARCDKDSPRICGKPMPVDAFESQLQQGKRFTGPRKGLTFPPVTP